MADDIANSQLIIYPNLGDDAYTAEDFNSRVMDF